MNSSNQKYAHAAPAAGKHESWLEEAITLDPVLAPLLPELRRLAASDASVLISGEPGSGRELVARAIHNLSVRADHPFLVIDCASLSEPLVEAELLGLEGPPHKPGIFEQAGEGSVLLTEVGDLPPRPRKRSSGCRPHGSCASTRTRRSRRPCAASSARAPICVLESRSGCSATVCTPTRPSSSRFHHSASGHRTSRRSRVTTSLSAAPTSRPSRRSSAARPRPASHVSLAREPARAA